MSGWKQPTILSRNKDNLNCVLMILETNKKEGEEYLYYSFKTNDACSNLVNLKGVALASIGISNSVFCDDYRIFTFYDNKTNLKYKLKSKSFYKYYIVSVIMPSLTPDNILLFVCNEFIEFILSFFENFEDTKKYFDVLNKYCENLFYYTLMFALEREKEDFLGSAINNIPIMNALFSYNECNPCYIIKPPINDNLRAEIIEFINNIYADRSVLQENITLMDPPFYLNGILITFRGFVIFNTLSNSEFLSICRVGNLYEVLDRTHNCPEILICEYLFKNDKVDNPIKMINIDNIGCGGDTRKKFLTTILSQREFTIFVSLEILGKSNCSFDPFFQRRAEDILIGVLKRGFGTILNNELLSYAVRPIQNDIKENEENIFNNFETDDNVNLNNINLLTNENIGNVNLKNNAKNEIKNPNTTTNKFLEEENLRKNSSKSNFKNNKIVRKDSHNSSNSIENNNSLSNNNTNNNNYNASKLNSGNPNVHINNNNSSYAIGNRNKININLNKESNNADVEGNNIINPNANANTNNNNNNNYTSENPYATNNINLNMNLNSKFKGYVDNETKVNIIQFSCFDDTECVINTTDIYANPRLFQGIYKVIFNEYAKIQTNINKLKNRNKQLKLRKIFNYENVVRNYSNFNIDTIKPLNENVCQKLNFKNEPITKTKLIKENFLRNLNAFKINEYAIKFCADDNMPIWISCKIYEHSLIYEETNLDEFSNYKIIFISYESPYPVDIDSFCQDLLINEFFM